jgi:hypothetical protein
MHKLLGLVELFEKMIVEGFFLGGRECPHIQKEEVKGLKKKMNSKNSLPPIKAFCPSEIHTSNISMKFQSTLAAWTLMMLFSEMVKFLNFYFFSMNKTL